jgi:hypothetical protein
MFSKKFIGMPKENISGIHNYCDRWCERCSFTSRCEIFGTSPDIDSEEQDVRKEAFRERLAENFSKATHLLKQTAEKSGVDFTLLQNEILQAHQREEQIRARSEEHALNKMSWQYHQLARKWLDTQPGMIEKLIALKEQLEAGGKDQQEATKTTRTIKDCLAVVQWYSLFIHTKLMRAVMGVMNDESNTRDDVQQDYNGSAKIVLLAIERSMQAWIKLFDLLPDREDDFLEILALLEKMKTSIFVLFPKAMEFRRPGFDETYVS